MKNNLFNEAFNGKGKVYVPQNASEADLIGISIDDFQTILKDLRTSFENIPEIEINFLDGNQLGGHATIHNERYYIGIQKGSLKILVNIFFRMLSNPSIFSKLGKSHDENEIERVVLAQIANYEIFVDSEIKTEFPKDIKRAKVAIKMVGSAMRQLFLHELAHLLRGHYQWLYIKNNITKCEPLFYQAMEMDADRFGIILVLNQFKLEDEKAILPNNHYALEEQLFIWAFALATMLNLVPNLERAEDFIKKNTPPIASRYGIMTAETVFNVFKDHKNIDEIRSIMSEAMALPKDAFSKIQSNFTYIHLKMSYSPEIINHTRKITSAWMKFEKELSATSLLS